MGISYSIDADPDVTAKAMGRDLPASHKDLVELCRYVKGMQVEDAEDALEAVVDQEEAIPLKTHNARKGHRGDLEGWDAGGYPEKAARHLLDILENAVGNAEHQGLNPEEMYVRHVAAHKVGESEGMKPRAFGRAGQWNGPLVDVELVLELNEKAREEEEE